MLQLTRVASSTALLSALRQDAALAVLCPLATSLGAASSTLLSISSREGMRCGYDAMVLQAKPTGTELVTYRTGAQEQPIRSNMTAIEELQSMLREEGTSLTDAQAEALALRFSGSIENFLAHRRAKLAIARAAPPRAPRATAFAARSGRFV